MEKRVFMTTIIRIRINYVVFAIYLYKMRLKMSIIYECEKEVAYLEHLMYRRNGEGKY